MSEIGQSVTRWLDGNITSIAKNALLVNRMVGWGGRFEYGKSVPVGVAVLYIDKVMLSVSDDQAELPEEGAKGFELLVDIKHMRVKDDPFISRGVEFKKARSRQDVLSACALRYAIGRINQKVYNSDIEGFYKWQGIFKSGDSYNAGDLVAYKGFVYQGTTGKGIPGNSTGWEQLDGRSVSTGIAVTTNYIVDGEGNFVIDENGKYVVAD